MHTEKFKKNPSYKKVAILPKSGIKYLYLAAINAGIALLAKSVCMSILNVVVLGVHAFKDCGGCQEEGTQLKSFGA